MLTIPQPAGFAERLHRVIRDAFDYAALEQLLWFRLQQRLDQITPAGTAFDTVVFRLVLWADQQGRLLDLARAVAAERPGSARSRTTSRGHGGRDLLRLTTRRGTSTDRLEGRSGRLGALARAYERIRRVMPSGDQRTIVMEEMVMKMGALATEHLRLADPFHLSPSAGDRLAVVVAIRRQPDERYLRWLSERLVVEAPFVGYQPPWPCSKSAQVLSDTCLNAVETARPRRPGVVEALTGRVRQAESSRRRDGSGDHAHDTTLTYRDPRRQPMAMPGVTFKEGSSGIPGGCILINLFGSTIRPRRQLAAAA